MGLPERPAGWAVAHRFIKFLVGKTSTRAPRATTSLPPQVSMSRTQSNGRLEESTDGHAESAFRSSYSDSQCLSANDRMDITYTSGNLAAARDSDPRPLSYTFTPRGRLPAAPGRPCQALNHRRFKSRNHCSEMSQSIRTGFGATVGPPGGGCSLTRYREPPAAFEPSACIA
jgi:hypothetical protein